MTVLNWFLRQERKISLGLELFIGDLITIAPYWNGGVPFSRSPNGGQISAQGPYVGDEGPAVDHPACGIVLAIISHLPVFHPAALLVKAVNDRPGAGRQAPAQTWS